MKSQYLLILFFILSQGCEEIQLRDIPPTINEEIEIDSPYINTATYFTIKNEGQNYRLYREDEEFYIKGGAFNSFVDKIDDFGGNAIRTYSVNDTTETRMFLDDAYYNGVSVMLGIWINRERDGFDYYDELAVEEQYIQCEKWVKQFKDHPALMMWALGNELNTTNPVAWSKINEIGEMINSIDPAHPVTTVLPGTQIPVINVIKDNCPSFALLGINSYEGAVSLVQSKLIEAGWDKPYIITELGQRGTWDGQVPFTSWGSTSGDGLIELTSTQKAAKYETIHRHDIIPYYNTSVTCLGSYTFLWGYQDRGHVITWYSMFNRFGVSLESAHTMRKMWTSLSSSNLPPRIEDNTDIKINGKTAFESMITNTAASNTATIIATDADDDVLTYEWIITREGCSFDRDNPGFEESLPPYSEATITPNGNTASFKVPQEGHYRLNCFVYDNHDNAAHASFPFKVEFKEDENRTPKEVTLFQDILMGMQANSSVEQFIDVETLNKYFYEYDPKGIDNAEEIDLAFYRSSVSGLCITTPLETTAAQYIYMGTYGFGNWSPRNNTQYAMPDNADFSINDFQNLTDDGMVYEVFHDATPLQTFKNISVDNIILFKSVNGSYGAILIKEFEDSTTGTVKFDIVVHID